MTPLARLQNILVCLWVMFAAWSGATGEISVLASALLVVLGIGMMVQQDKGTGGT